MISICGNVFSEELFIQSGDHYKYKIHSNIKKLYEKYTENKEEAFIFSKQRNLGLDDSGKITVYIKLENLDDVDSETELKNIPEVMIIKKKGRIIKVKIPISELKQIAEKIKGISLIKFPDRPQRLNTTSEGVALTYASNYQSEGYKGSNVKIAIIDKGFYKLDSAISNGDLPNNVTKIDCTGTSCVSSAFSSETEKHGTAVAEIVYDMAPGANLYLIKIDDSLDLVDAKDYCINNGIKIVNHSVGWFNMNFYDGKCYDSNPVCTANNAYSNGILWVNAAGVNDHPYGAKA
jgi:hypothetical protein